MTVTVGFEPTDSGAASGLPLDWRARVHACACPFILSGTSRSLGVYSRMPADFADNSAGRWDGSGTLSEPCAEPSCKFHGEYHRFSGHTVE